MRTSCRARGTLLSALGDLNGQGIQKRGDMCLCTCVAESLSCKYKLVTQHCKATI